MSALPRSVGRRRRAGDPVDGAAALGAGLVGPDLAGAGGLDSEPELLLQRAADGAPDGMVLPAGGRGDLLERGALGTLEHLDHLRLLGAGPRRGLRGRLIGRGRLALTGRRRGRGSLLALALGRPRLGSLLRAVGLAGGSRGVDRAVAPRRRRARVGGRRGVLVLRLDADRGHALAGDDHAFGAAVAT